MLKVRWCVWPAAFAHARSWFSPEISDQLSCERLTVRMVLGGCCHRNRVHSGALRNAPRTVEGAKSPLCLYRKDFGERPQSQSQQAEHECRRLTGNIQSFRIKPKIPASKTQKTRRQQISVLCRNDVGSGSHTTPTWPCSWDICSISLFSLAGSIHSLDLFGLSLRLLCASEFMLRVLASGVPIMSLPHRIFTVWLCAVKANILGPYSLTMLCCRS